jgi:hypothetical protein
MVWTESPLPMCPRNASTSSSSSSISSYHGDSKKMPAASRASGRRKNWSSFDLGAYRLAALSCSAEALAATQTSESRGGRRGRNSRRRPGRSSSSRRSRRGRCPAAPRRWIRSSSTRQRGASKLRLP